MRNTITAEEFMKKNRIDGAVHTLNGPRLYIDSVPTRVYPQHQGAVHQVAFIDLVSYTPHCTTMSQSLSPIQCRNKSKEIETRLAPVARLARIQKVTVPGTRPQYTQKRVLYSQLREAGVICAMDDRGIVIDMESVVRLTKGPWSVMRRDYRIRIEAVSGHAQWDLPMESREMVVAALSGDVMLGARVKVSAFTIDPDDDIIASLHVAMNEVLAAAL